MAVGASRRTGPAHPASESVERADDASALRPHVVGQPLPRVDGRLKVTGAARYTAERAPEGLLHGVAIGSAIPCGPVASIDAREAEALAALIGHPPQTMRDGLSATLKPR